MEEGASGGRVLQDDDSDGASRRPAHPATPSAIDKLAGYGLSKDELIRFAIPHRGVASRLVKHRTVAPTEREAQRVLDVFEFADSVFGDRDKAQVWLRKPCRAIGGVVPIDLLESDAGAALVREELVRIEHGIYV